MAAGRQYLSHHRAGLERVYQRTRYFTPHPETCRRHDAHDADQCFAVYFVAHGARGWYWSMAALCTIGFLGYINTEVNAKLNPTENAHIMVFYGKHLHLLQISTLFLAFLCAVIAYPSSWSDETLGWLSLPLMNRVCHRRRSHAVTPGAIRTGGTI